ncbi:hypothetical protein CCMSSC00406_0005903 [Pleurotus cornucopiae]|uniref:Uncharacterized protein n=1 Tax=Pleurotus cornucopiae TaxID=5321 RepID=A0ACB7IJ35_PLECO|nr:hypothetical protein CCMSSC00406_0005903 [Pleurotus cornucopiae]
MTLIEDADSPHRADITLDHLHMQPWKDAKGEIERKMLSLSQWNGFYKRRRQYSGFALSSLGLQSTRYATSMPIQTRGHKKAEAQANLDTPDPTPDPSTDSSPEDYDDDDDPDYSPGSEADSGTDNTPASRSTAAGKPSRAGKGHRRNWSSTSICNESNPVIITRFNSWKSRLRSLIAEAEEEGIDGYDEVQSVAVAAAESLAIVESVDEYKKKAENSHRDVKVVAFSRASRKDLERMSLNNITTIDFNSLLEVIKGQMLASHLEVIKTAAPFLQTVLEELSGLVGPNTEAGARISIDQCLLAANRILKAHFALTAWTELSLSSSSDNPVYIEEEKGNKTTFLTGIIDYGVGSMKRLVTDLDIIQSQAVSIATETQTRQTVADFGSYRLGFAVIEAKNDRENLKKHIPQVVLQCIALGKDWTADRSDKVVFCLANSKRWIFGVVDRASKSIYHTDEVSIAGHKTGVFDILLALIFWVSTRSEDILAAMKKTEACV